LERTNAGLNTLLHEGQMELATLRARLQGAEERAKGLESALAATALESRRSTRGHSKKISSSGRRVAGASGTKQVP